MARKTATPRSAPASIPPRSSREPSSQSMRGSAIPRSTRMPLALTPNWPLSCAPPPKPTDKNQQDHLISLRDRRHLRSLYGGMGYPVRGRPAQEDRTSSSVTSRHRPLSQHR